MRGLPLLHRRLAVLMGLAVGYISNIGKSTYIAQAKGMLQETAYQCKEASTGGRRATFSLRKAGDPISIGGLKISATGTCLPSSGAGSWKRTRN